jgi:hypothetical protein
LWERVRERGNSGFILPVEKEVSIKKDPSAALGMTYLRKIPRLRSG